MCDVFNYIALKEKLFGVKNASITCCLISRFLHLSRIFSSHSFYTNVSTTYSEYYSLLRNFSQYSKSCIYHLCDVIRKRRKGKPPWIGVARHGAGAARHWQLMLHQQKRHEMDKPSLNLQASSNTNHNREKKKGWITRSQERWSTRWLTQDFLSRPSEKWRMNRGDFGIKSLHTLLKSVREQT